MPTEIIRIAIILEQDNDIAVENPMEEKQSSIFVPGDSPVFSRDTENLFARAHGNGPVRGTIVCDDEAERFRR